MVYAKDVLGELIPIALPQDDFELYSSILKSLETRTDLTWRIYEESDIRGTIMSVANRKQPDVAKKYSIASRSNALYKHWDSQARQPGKPERWEEASSTTFVKPLLHGHSIEASEKGTGEGFKLVLNAEQSAHADKVYRKWRKKYDREAAYLKDHPPNPIGWAPITRVNADVRNEVFQDDKGKTQRRPRHSKLLGNKGWKPIYGTFHDVPYSFRVPGEPEPSQEELQEEFDAIKADHNAREARRKRQEAYEKELKAEKKQKEEALRVKEKNEL